MGACEAPLKRRRLMMLLDLSVSGPLSRPAPKRQGRYLGKIWRGGERSICDASSAVGVRPQYFYTTTAFVVPWAAATTTMIDGLRLHVTMRQTPIEFSSWHPQPPVSVGASGPVAITPPVWAGPGWIEGVLVFSYIGRALGWMASKTLSSVPFFPLVNYFTPVFFPFRHSHFFVVSFVVS